MLRDDGAYVYYDEDSLRGLKMAEKRSATDIELDEKIVEDKNIAEAAVTENTNPVAVNN